ncbi:MFS transporter, partial [Streptomyces xanthophaeus]
SLAGISAFVYGVIEAPNRGWGDPAVLVTLLGGIALIGVLLLWLRRAAHPLVDLSLFRDARFAWATATVSLVMFILLGVLFVVPQYLQQVQGHDAMATGIRLLPLIGALLVATVAGEKLVARFGTKAVVATGMLLWTVGLLHLAGLTADSGYEMTAIALAVVGAALGLTLPTTLDTILGTLPPERVGAGSALANTCRQIGAAVGVAVLGSTLNSVYRDRLEEDAPAQLTGKALDAALDNIAGAEAAAARLPGAEGVQVLDAARNAFVSGMSATALVCAVVAAATAVMVVALLPARGRSSAEAGTPPSQPDGAASAQV